MSYPFEALPLHPTADQEADFQVYAIVEQVEGSTERTVWDETRREFVKTGLVMSRPLPAPYGWIPQTHSQGDHDPLDVLILSETQLAQGDFLVVRPIGVLLRRDADHKVLAVDIKDTRFGSLAEYHELPGEFLTKIEDWFRPYFELDGWADAAGARRMIEEDHATFLSL